MNIHDLEAKLTAYAVSHQHANPFWSFGFDRLRHDPGGTFVDQWHIRYWSSHFEKNPKYGSGSTLQNAWDAFIGTENVTDILDDQMVEPALPELPDLELPLALSDTESVVGCSSN